MNWINYLIQTNLYLLCFYALYKLAFSKETYFNLNRAYLVGFTFTSFFIPFWQSGVMQSWFITKQISHTIYTSGLNEVIIYKSPIAKAQPFFDLLDWMVLLYTLGVVYMTVHFCINLFKAQQFVNSKNTQGLASSFLGKINIDKHLPYQDVLLKHEETHSKGAHSVDLILVEIVKIICWFNPISYLIQIELKSIHEFIADNAAAKVLGSRKAYADILVSNQFDTTTNSLVHNFYSLPTIKTRLIMLGKRKSTKRAILKYGMVAPAFIGTLILASSFVSKSERNNVVSENPATLLTSLFSNNLSAINKKETESKGLIEIKGQIISEDKGALGGAEIRINDSNRISVSNTDGRFLVKNVEDNDMVTISYIGYQEAKYKVTELPENIILRKKPFQLNEIVVSTYRGLPSSQVANEEEKEVSLLSEPKFPGGEKAMYHFIGSNLIYPFPAKRANIEGEVHVEFVINKDGVVSEPIITNGIGFGCDKEVQRIVGLMPKWNPARQNGEAVEVKYQMKVKFKLEERSESQIKESNIPNNSIYTTVEVLPEFPGGTEAMYKFIGQNMKYPKEAQKENIKGSVYIKFIVTTEGEIKDLNIVKGIGYGCEDAVIEVFSKMPKWNPGMQSGTPVNVYYTMPIAFLLE